MTTQPVTIGKGGGAVPVIPGRLYRHLKTGGFYRVLHHAVDENTLRPVVVYVPVPRDGRSMWVRPWDQFSDGRFELCSKGAKALCEKDGTIHVRQDNGTWITHPKD
jgi:hypothetical protein